VWGQPHGTEPGTSLPVTCDPWLQGVKADPEHPSGTWMSNPCLSPTDAHTQRGAVAKCLQRAQIKKL